MQLNELFYSIKITISFWKGIFCCRRNK